MNFYVVVMCMAIITFFTRSMPFIIFKNKSMPSYLKELGDKLPLSIIVLLIIYCIKDINFMYGNRGIPELISIITVIVVHKWKHNILLSILIGTALYMYLIQSVF